MFKLHDNISETKGHKEIVVYIHPAGRFYTTKFVFDGGSYPESHQFTAKQLQEGLNEGLFPKYYENMAAFRDLSLPTHLHISEDAFPDENLQKRHAPATFDEFAAMY